MCPAATRGTLLPGRHRTPDARPWPASILPRMNEDSAGGCVVPYAQSSTWRGNPTLHQRPRGPFVVRDAGHSRPPPFHVKRSRAPLRVAHGHKHAVSRETASFGMFAWLRVSRPLVALNRNMCVISRGTSRGGLCRTVGSHVVRRRTARYWSRHRPRPGPELLRFT